MHFPFDFGNFCFLKKIMLNIQKAHYILEEMVMNGQIVETNKALILGMLFGVKKDGAFRHK